MANKPYPNEDVISGIQAGGHTQELWLQKIYDQHFSMVYQALRKHKVSEEQAIDAYSDAMIDFRRMVLNGSFRGDSGYFTFLYRIFFNKILNAITKNKTKRVEWVNDMPEYLTDADQDLATIMETTEDYEILIHFMDTLGDPCRSLLLDSGYWGFTMDEIAERYQIKDAATARSKKFHCLKKLQLIIQSPKQASS